MFVHRNSIIVALCLSFPSVADASCIELATCFAAFPQRAKCSVGYGDGSTKEFFVCCQEGMETPDFQSATCTSVFSDDDGVLADDLADAIADATALAEDRPEGPAPCYESGEVGNTCRDPVNPVEASCESTAFGVLRTYGACCKKNAEIPFTTDVLAVCSYLSSSAPTVGAWTVTAVGAVATTAAAFYGI